MTPDTCGLCRGKLHWGETDFVARVGDEVISIRGVAAYVCENCGEAYFTPEISRKIDEVMEDFHQGKLSARPIAARELELKA